MEIKITYYVLRIMELIIIEMIIYYEVVIQLLEYLS